MDIETEYDKYFKRLLKDRVSYIEDINITRNLGKKYPDLFDEDNGFMDIARIKKRNVSALVLRPGAGLAPMTPNSSTNRKKKYKFFRIF